MKSLLYCLAGIFSAMSFQPGNAQTSGDNSIPAFHIALTDSSYFNKNDLKKRQPLMLVYFSPDCAHCQDFTREMIRDYEKLKGVQIVMISNRPIPEVKKFESVFELRKYKNIRVGTEGNTFRIQRHYQVTKFPFIALFDNTGNTIAIYKDPPPGNAICQAFKTCRF